MNDNEEMVPDLDLELVQIAKPKTIQDLVIEYTLIGNRCDLILQKIKSRKSKNSK